MNSAARADAKARGVCSACQRRPIAVGRSRCKCAGCLDADNAAHKAGKPGKRLCVICAGRGHNRRTCPRRHLGSAA